MRDIAYPPTPRIDVVEQRFGVAATDAYRWLEGDARTDPEIEAWVAAQNAVTQQYLDTLPGREVFRQRMTALLNDERCSPPQKHGGRYFFSRGEGAANQASLYMRDSLHGENRLVLDPNTWSADGGDALAEWAVSDDGRWLAYAVQVGGTDWRTIKVLDTDTGDVLPDAVQWARFTRLAWSPDGAGFFYSRFPQPASGAAATAGVAHHAVYFHALGTPQAEDRLIHASPLQPALLHMADRATDGRYLYLSSTPGTNECEFRIVDLHDAAWTPRVLAADAVFEWIPIGCVGTTLVLITTDGAERRRVVSVDLGQPDLVPVELVAEAADGAVLHDAAWLGGALLIGYLVDARTEIRRFRMDGTPDGAVPLPSIGTAGGLLGSPNDDEAFFVFTSFNFPTSVYRYDVRTRVVEPWARPAAPIDLSRIAVTQRFYHAKDGTEIPLFLVRRLDVTEAAPTLLYGYGGFGISLVPVYNALQLAWVEQGGVLAIANIRGGGEYGRAWHRDGQLINKQNAFDDFIAAGEFLKAAGITSPQGLAIQGESGGGLLVGAVTNQRPDLFDVALPGVGVMDMARYDQFTGGALWMGEFGDPADEAHWRNLLSYSPYHTIKPGVDYPAILATTADADDRVVPAHTFKYVAALQAQDLGRKPHLIRVETRAGHGAGMPLTKLIALHADMWAFAARWTGLTVQD